MHADLTTAQQDATRTPYVELVFRSRDRATTRTYKTTDGTNRIAMVQQAEGRTNGHITTPGGDYSAVIRFRDDDNALGALDWKGYRLEIGWGFNTTSGDKSSQAGPQFVVRQRKVSIEGELILELYCLSLWNLAKELLVNESSAAPVIWDADTSARHILQELLGGTVFDAVIQDDGGAFTDYTSESQDTTADNVLLLPTTPAVNDAVYFGKSAQFERISPDLTTVGSGFVVVLENWNGSTWVTLATTDDGTSGLTVGELKIIAWLRPSGWATTTINGQGPFYYVRLRVTSVTTPTQPKATRIYGGIDFAIALDTSDAAQGDDFQPSFETDYRQGTRDVVEQILNFTLLGITVLDDGFHLRYINNAEAGNDYQYNSSHAFYSDVEEASPIIPNKLIYVDREPSDVSGHLSGDDEDTASSGAIGLFTAVVVDPSIASGSDATEQAERHIKRLLRDASQGAIIVPMNCGQEIWDRVEVVDGRTSATFQGRVSHLVRTYDPSADIYLLEIEMGGYSAIARGELQQLLFQRQVAAARRAMEARGRSFVQMQIALERAANNQRDQNERIEAMQDSLTAMQESTEWIAEQVRKQQEIREGFKDTIREIEERSLVFGPQLPLPPPFLGQPVENRRTLPPSFLPPPAFGPTIEEMTPGVLPGPVPVESRTTAPASFLPAPATGTTPEEMIEPPIVAAPPLPIIELPPGLVQIMD